VGKSPDDRARSRVAELRKDGISVPPDLAAALPLFDMSGNTTLDKACITALMVRSGLSHDHDFAHSVADAGASSAYRAATAASSSGYVLDSGATRHFTTRRADLTGYTPYTTHHPVGGAFGSKGRADGKGTLTLKLPGGPLRLEKVMLVPDLGVNLIALNRLMMDGIKVSNSATTLTLTAPGGKKLVDLKLTPTVMLEASRLLRSSAHLALAAVADPSLMHGRLRQLSDERLGWLLSRSEGGATMSTSPSTSCELCVLGKATQTGVASTSLELPPTRALERLVVDTWGPAPVRGRLGQRFALLVLDRYSGYAWCKVLSSKAAIPQYLVDLMRRLERESGSPIVELLSDNGTEFINSTVGRYTTRQGIHHRRSVPYVHQNGFVENRFRTLFATACTLLASSPLPLSFWPEAFETAVYLLNRSPSVALPSKATPFDLYHGRPAPLEHLRVWGCKAYISLPPDGPRRPHKLAPRAVEARFVGYPSSQKGWLFWVPAWGKVVTVWSVARWYERDAAPSESLIDERVSEFVLDELDELLGPPLDPLAAAGGGEQVAEEMPHPGEGAAGGAEAPEGEQGAAETSQEGMRAPGAGVEGAAGQEGDKRVEPDPTPPPEGPARRSQRLAGVDGATLPTYRPLQGAPGVIAGPARRPERREPPPAPRKPPARTSLRIGGVKGSSLPFYRDLAGVPAARYLCLKTFRPPDAAVALPLWAEAQQHVPLGPGRQLLLALAAFDASLDTDLEAIEACEVEAAEGASEATLITAAERSLATWSGSLDKPTYAQAMARPDADKWLEAMHAELAAFEVTGTWEPDLVDLPDGRRAVGAKWVLVIKRDAEGRVIKYKARLVARGDQQVEGLDFGDTHSSTVRLTTCRLLFAILAASPSFTVAQFDVSNAYLLGKLDRPIYLSQAPGFVDPTRPRSARLLKKALYGLQQGGAEWQKVVRSALEHVGFSRCENDHGLHVRRRGGKVAFVPVHVDDGKIIGNDDASEIIAELNEQLSGKLRRVEPGLFLGMRFQRRPDGTVELSQQHYARAVLDRFFPNGLSAVATPLDSSYSALVAADETERFECPYRELLGALVYLSACTRPDLAFALSFASRFASCPARRHWSMLTHIARYLSGTAALGLVYSPPSTGGFKASLVSGWSDADPGADKDTRRSVSGFVFGVGDDSLRLTAISWLSRRQKSVAISSCEAEYVALSESAREAVWLRALLAELGFPLFSPTTIRGDNTGALILAKHPSAHSRTKLIGVHYHYTRERVAEGVLELRWVKTDDMVADVFTKGLGRVKHELFSLRCGLRDLRRKGGCERGALEAREGRAGVSESPRREEG